MQSTNGRKLERICLAKPPLFYSSCLASPSPCPCLPLPLLRPPAWLAPPHLRPRHLWEQIERRGPLGSVGVHRYWRGFLLEGFRRHPFFARGLSSSIDQVELEHLRLEPARFPATHAQSQDAAGLQVHMMALLRKRERGGERSGQEEEEEEAARRVARGRKMQQQPRRSNNHGSPFQVSEKTSNVPPSNGAEDSCKQILPTPAAIHCPLLSLV